MRKDLVGKNEEISITKQCKLLDVSRNAFYYKPIGLTDEDLDILGRIDKIFTEFPYYGTRRIKAALRLEGIDIGRRKVRKYMNVLNIYAIYPKKVLTIADKDHKKYPYLLRNMAVTHVNQVWSTDITYIKLQRGYVYLTAVIDWYSRCVLSWKISTTLDRQFCIDAVVEAIENYGVPEYFNTDQGSQYTSDDFTGVLKSHNIKISMNSKGRALDNIFVERLWRTVKYDDVYIKDYRNVSECKTGLQEYFKTYNERRLHQELDYKTPMDVHKKELEKLIAA